MIVRLKLRSSDHLIMKMGTKLDHQFWLEFGCTMAVRVANFIQYFVLLMFFPLNKSNNKLAMPHFIQTGVRGSPILNAATRQSPQGMQDACCSVCSTVYWQTSSKVYYIGNKAVLQKCECVARHQL